VVQAPQADDRAAGVQDGRRGRALRAGRSRRTPTWLSVPLLPCEPLHLDVLEIAVRQYVDGVYES
jgi:hypothetical protein